VQKHAASRLHYDFRLELGGVLKSWAVPKGVPYKKGEKRLAMQVEDHPVSYVDFEGTIPAGQYGGGTVMVWDTGTFEPMSEAPLKDLAGGKLHFVLDGKKLHGEWYLVRMHEGNQWLLIRGRDDMTPVSKKADDTSALSGKTMAAIANARRGRVWVAKKSAEPEARRNLQRETRRPHRAAGSRGAPPAKSRLKFIEPMKALLVEKPPPGDWIYEIKFDGFRALAIRDTDGTQLLSRNNKDFAEKFPEVFDAVAALELNDAIIDGEIVALDAKGRSSFQLLQAFELGQQRPPILFYAFDLLRLNGRDLRTRPLAERKAELERMLKDAPDTIRFSASLGNEPEKLLRQARELGLEGLIGKRADSTYEAGRRSGAWIKLKLHREQEFVIGGYTPPGGARSHFGALLVGVYEGKELKFAGKVGTGFDAARLRALHEKFKKLAADTCPFVDLPEQRGRRYGQAMTAAELKRVHWVKPVMVCQLRFSEWTRDHRLRQPVFLGLREDKAATEVVREKEA